jgi:hypothetical protein
MTALLQLRDGIAQGLSEDPGLVALTATVYVHGGDFKLEDLKRYFVSAPALALALLNVEVERQGPAQVAVCSFGLVCINKATSGQDQHSRCIELVDAAIRALKDRWWVDSLSLTPPVEISARNLFGTPLDKTGVAMWALGFQQSVDLVAEDLTLADWKRWYAVWDLLPELDPDRPHATDAGGDWTGVTPLPPTWEPSSGG